MAYLVAHNKPYYSYAAVFDTLDEAEADFADEARYVPGADEDRATTLWLAEVIKSTPVSQY